MPRVQLALNVEHLEEAIAFYSKLFATPPAKVRPLYANFAVAEPPLKLVLIEDPTQAPGSLNHLGIEVEHPEQVVEAKERLDLAGLSTTMENRVACCYAVQDKVWVSGPGAEPWEIYAVLDDAELGPEAASSGEPTSQACCAGRPDLAAARPSSEC